MSITLFRTEMFKRSLQGIRCRDRKARLIAACLWIVCLIEAGLIASDASAQGRRELVVQSGDSTPNGDGQFSTFGSPNLSDLGIVTFWTVLENTSAGFLDDNGIFRHSGGNAIRIAREGETAPDGNGEFLNFETPTHNDFGAAAFLAFVRNTNGGISDDRGVFRGSGGSVTQIAREGEVAPGGNGEFARFNEPALNASGTVTFHAVLRNTSGGFLDNVGIFHGDGGNVRHVVRSGQAVPGGNGQFAGFSDPALNAAGTIAFFATLRNTTGGTLDDSGIFLVAQSASPTWVVRAGQAAPDANGEFANFSPPVLNDAGSVAFTAGLSNTSGGSSDNRGVFRASGGNLMQIARRGQTANGNGMFDLFFDPAINASGDVAFLTHLENTTGGLFDNNAIFRGNGLTLTEIVRTDQAAPDGNGKYISFETAALNDSGATAFRARLRDTSGGFTDDRGIFIGDGTDLVQAVREGEMIDGSVITELSFRTGTAQDSGFNRHGQVAYRAILQDGRQVIATFTPDLHWRGNSTSFWDLGSRWTLGLTPAQVHDVFIDPAASLTVQGPTSATTVRSLEIGGGTGIATLRLQRGAVLTTTNSSGAIVRPTGVLTGDGVIAGNVNNFGTIVADNVTVQSTLSNRGVIRGDGRISGSIFNQVSGEFRVGPAERMVIAGPSFGSLGTVEIVSGEMEIQSTVAASNGEINVIDGTFRSRSPFDNRVGALISASDAFLHFEGDLNNDAGIGFTTGQTHVFGDVNNSSTGNIHISSGHVTFYDDLDQNGNLIVASVGQTNSVAVLFGAFTGAGGFTGGGDVFSFGDLRPGNSPDSVLMDGNLFLGATANTFIELGGLGIGEFDQLIVTGDLSVDGNLFVDLINGYQLPGNDEFLIAEVGELLTGEFIGLSDGDLVGNFGGTDLFITYSGGDGNDILLFTIPEPNAYAIVVLFSIFTVSRRRKRQTADRH